MKKRRQVFTVSTPLPQAPTVTLYENTWEDHIQQNHPEMLGKLANMRDTLSAPSYVCEATNPNYFMFVNTNDTDVNGKIHVVCVSPIDSDGPAVTTSYYGGAKYKPPLKVKKVWP